MTDRKECKMTINDLITSPPTKMKLGTVDGGGFVFCGDFVPETIEKLDDEIIIKWAITVANAKSRIKTLKASKERGAYKESLEKNKKRCITKAKSEAKEEGKTLTDAEIDKISEEWTFTEERYEAHLVNTDRKIKSAEKTLHSTVRKLKKFDSIANRDIVEKYHSITEPDTEIVIITGRERGEVWTTKEYEERSEE